MHVFDELPVELLELKPVALGDCVMVPVTDGTSTTGSEIAREAARSTGFTPVNEL